MSGRLPDMPVRRAVNLQRWVDLTFLHWRYPAEPLRRFLPAGLELQLLDGSPWVALTPFFMSGLRPPGVPPVPGVSAFAETNLRTYVTDGDHDGILFLRVHCASRPMTAAFRVGVGLPYAYVPGSVRSDGGTTTYRMGATRVTVAHGAAVVPDPVLDSLTGRWSAFTRHLGVLWRVPVEHEPWPLQETRVSQLRTDMFARAGLPEPDAEPLAHFSPGVGVRLGPPRRAGRSAAGGRRSRSGTSRGHR